MQACRSEARALGYTLLVDECRTWASSRMRRSLLRTSRLMPMGRFLTYGRSAVEAAELDADLLEGIVKRNELWPSE